MGQALTPKFGVCHGSAVLGTRIPGRAGPACPSQPGVPVGHTTGPHGPGSEGRSGAPTHGGLRAAAAPSRSHSRKDTGAGAAAGRGERCRRTAASRAAERSPSRSMAPRPPQRCPGRGGAGAAACSEPERPQSPGSAGRRGTAVGRA